METIEISEKLLTVLIAGGVSLVGGLISYFASDRTTKQTLASKERQFEQEIKIKFIEKLYELRLQCYPEAFANTGKIKRKKAPDFINSQEELREILNSLETWVEEEAGLFLSKDAIRAHRELREVLGKNPAFQNKYSKEQADKIWEARNEFRKWLRRDLRNIYSGDWLGY